VVPFSLIFQGAGSRSYSRGECGTPSSHVFWERGLPTEHQVIEPSNGDFRGRKIRSVEL
jgi:hypothetical protein